MEAVAVYLISLLVQSMSLLRKALFNSLVKILNSYQTGNQRHGLVLICVICGY